MKIGILAFRQVPYISANTAIAYIIGEQLSITNEVVFIGRRQDDKQTQKTDYKGIKVRFLNEKPKQYSSRIENYLVRMNCIHLAYWHDAKALRRIVQEESIEALLCLVAPSDDAYITISAELSIPVYLYQLDPFYNLMDVENERLKKQFLLFLPRFEHVFTTDLLAEEYQNDPQFSGFMNKISVVQFPKLVNYEANTKEDGKRKKRMVLLYAGSIYAGRNPRFLVDLKECLPDECDTVFCGVCEKNEDLELLVNSGIQCKGYCSQEVLRQEMEKADFYINIGNTVRNQLPSKVIDYIATGKPIINITQIDYCPTIKVLESYGASLSISAKEILERKNMIQSFIKENRGKTIPYSTIKQQYCEYTPEFVSKTILEIITRHYS